MELNNLLSNLKKTQSDTPKYLAIEIGGESVKSAVWEVLGPKPNLVETGSVEQTNSSDPDELLKAVDLSISKALADIAPEPDEVVFSLPENWLNEQDILEDKKQLLKHLCQKLALKPAGYVVSTEALIHYLQSKQGQPVNTVMLGINSEEIIVSLVTNSVLEGTHFVGRSDDIGADIEEGIARFDEVKTLPSSLTLYDGHTDLEELKQQLINYDWQERLPFLHIPKISTLTADESIKAVVATGGAEVIKSLQVSGNTPPETEESLLEDESPIEDEIPDKSEEFGFTISEPTAIIEGQDEDENLADQISPEDDNVVPAGELEDMMQDPQEDETEEEFVPPASATVKKSRFLPRFGGLFARKPRVRGGRSSLPIMVAGALVAFLLVGAGLGAAYWYVPKAQVTIYIQPQNIQKEIELTVDPSLNEVNFEQVGIPGRIRETSVETSAQLATSGEKLVGERSSGSVTIYNRTSSAKTLEAGTVLSGPDNLKYTISQEVSIASASTKENPNDLSITTEPSTAKVQVQAETIGAQYNMGSGTEFGVGSFDKSSFVAKADGDISGGSSRQITAVAASDIQSLKDQVMAELEDKILNQVNQNPDDFMGVVVLPDQEDNLEETFSAEVGDEVDQVSLTGKLTVETMTYKKSDLNLIIENLSRESIPSGYKLIAETSSIDIDEIDSQESGAIRLSALAKAKVMPTLDTAEIARTITGRFPIKTENYFKGLAGFSRVEIDINPDLPPKLKAFPRITENINVEVKTIE